MKTVATQVQRTSDVPRKSGGSNQPDIRAGDVSVVEVVEASRPASVVTLTMAVVGAAVTPTSKEHETTTATERFLSIPPSIIEPKRQRPGAAIA